MLHNNVTCHSYMSRCHTKMESYDNYRKIVHRLYSSCISSIQEIDLVNLDLE